MLKLCRKSWLADGVIGYNPERGPPKGHSIKVWSQLEMQFQEKIFKHFSNTEIVQSAGYKYIGTLHFYISHRVLC